MNTLSETIFSTLALHQRIMTAAAVNMMISMVSGIPIRTNSPSTIQPGRSDSKEPNRTTERAAIRKMATEILALFVATYSPFARLIGASPSFSRFPEMGSSFSSFPVLLAMTAAIMQAISVDGIQTIMISNRVT